MIMIKSIAYNGLPPTDTNNDRICCLHFTEITQKFKAIWLVWVYSLSLYLRVKLPVEELVVVQGLVT